jgi:prepilin-type processing-associated H-X9-DG protein
MENQELYNQWSMFGSSTTLGNYCVPYTDGVVAGAAVANLSAGQATNFKVASTAIGILKCPDDNSAQPQQGNLSYVVNGGFALWHAVPWGWTGTATDGSVPIQMHWATSGSAFVISEGICQKLGVFFQESTFPQGTSIKPPWNVRSSINSMPDGSSSTVMMGENTLAGFSTGSTASANQETNWAAPFPSFSTMIGSSNVCSATLPVSGSGPLDCTAGMLQPTGDVDGPGWSLANKVGTFQNIGYGQNLTLDGGFPFANSAHPSGGNYGFCDGGVRFITNTIDGTVYSKILTPGGSRLPIYCKQQPVNQDAYAQ